MTKERTQAGDERAAPRWIDSWPPVMYRHPEDRPPLQLVRCRCGAEWWVEGAQQMRLLSCRDCGGGR